MDRLESNSVDGKVNHCEDDYTRDKLDLDPIYIHSVNILYFTPCRLDSCNKIEEVVANLFSDGDVDRSPTELPFQT
jgi:hypothetical protein